MADKTPETKIEMPAASTPEAVRDHLMKPGTVEERMQRLNDWVERAKTMPKNDDAQKKARAAVLTETHEFWRGLYPVVQGELLRAQEAKNEASILTAKNREKAMFELNQKILDERRNTEGLTFTRAGVEAGELGQKYVRADVGTKMVAGAGLVAMLSLAWRNSKNWLRNTMIALAGMVGLTAVMENKRQENLRKATTPPTSTETKPEVPAAPATGPQKLPESPPPPKPAL